MRVDGHHLPWGPPLGGGAQNPNWVKKANARSALRMRVEGRFCDPKLTSGSNVKLKNLVLPFYTYDPTYEPKNRSCNDMTMK